MHYCMGKQNIPNPNSMYSAECQSVKISQFDGRSATHHHVPECVACFYLYTLILGHLQCVTVKHIHLSTLGWVSSCSRYILDRSAHQFLIKEAEKLGLHQSGSLLQDCSLKRTQDWLGHIFFGLFIQLTSSEVVVLWVLYSNYLLSKPWKTCFKLILSRCSVDMPAREPRDFRNHLG